MPLVAAKKSMKGDTGVHQLKLEEYRLHSYFLHSDVIELSWMAPLLAYITYYLLPSVASKREKIQ